MTLRRLKIGIPLVLVSLLLFIGLFSHSLLSHAGTNSGLTFRNPILGQGQDPWVEYANGSYYYIQSSPDQKSLTVRKASSLLTLGSTPIVTIWTGGNAGSPCCELWAPEIHFINGAWYVYYAADDGNNNNHRTYVLQSTNPLGPYTFKGKVSAPTDTWAIDGTIFQKSDGSLYFIWAGWLGTTNTQQNIFIAPMSNPWTISAERTLLSSPIYSWEKIGAPPTVNEGPEVIQHGGKIFITYSASGCWTPDYKLGMLSINATSNLLNAASWTKSTQPVFQRNDANGVYGPGHNGFFKSPDGTQDWIVYHAVTDSAGNCFTERTVRAQKINWNSDGTPNFGVPVSLDTSLALPSGDPGPADNGNGIVYGSTYKLVNLTSGLNLDVAGGSTAPGGIVQQWTDNGLAPQHWKVVDAGGGYATLINQNSGLCLDVSGGSTAAGAKIEQWTCNGLAPQRWRIDYMNGGYYRLIAQVSGMALDVIGGSTAAGAGIDQWNDNGTGAQRWRLVATDGGVTSGNYYTLNPQVSGLCLDVSGGSTLPGGTIQQWNCNGMVPQHWRVDYMGGGYYRLTAQVSGMELDVAGGSTAAGGKIDQWPGNDLAPQRWRIDYMGGGYYKLTNQNSGLCLDVSGGSTAAGAAIEQWTDNGATAQRWSMHSLN